MKHCKNHHIPFLFFACIALLLCFSLSQCAITPETLSFSPLDSENGRAVRNSCVKSTSISGIIRASIDVEWKIPSHNNENAGSLTTTCLWYPGKALRLRVRRFGITTGEILYNNSKWYLADDIEGTVFIINTIADLRINGIPPAFLATLATVPEYGWLPPENARAAAADVDDLFRFSWQNKNMHYTTYFKPASPLPEYAEILHINGATLSLRFSHVKTGLTHNAHIFAPRYDTYEKHFLDL